MTTRLDWPVSSSAPVTQGFGENPEVYARFGLAGHNGVDFGVPTGTVVRSAGAGTVCRAMDDPNGYGRHVRIDHGSFITIYAHLSRLDAGTGQPVAAGEGLGLSGSTGFSTGPHLHFEVRFKDQAGNGYQGAVDPLPLLTGAGTDGDEGAAPSPVGTITAGTAVRLRTRPELGNTCRGIVRAGDVLALADSRRVAVGAYTFVPVVVWTAVDFYQQGPAAGQP